MNNAWAVACHQRDLLGLEKLRDNCLPCDPSVDLESTVVQMSSDSVTCQPVFVTSSDDEGNTAIHYAALSDFTESLDILTTVLSTMQNDCSRFDAAITLLSLRNNHGDTSIMMLCVYDFTNTLRCWIDYVIQTGIQEGMAPQHIQSVLVQTLSLTNHSNDTALSLAFGHGNYRIVECLLEDRNTVVVSHSDLDRCKLVLEKVNALIEALQRQKESTDTQSSMIQEGIRRRDDIRRSLALLQVACTKLAHKTMIHLLEDENKATKKKELPRRKCTQSSSKNKNTSQNPEERMDHALDRDHSLAPEKPIVTTLMDGSVVTPKAMREATVGSDDTLDHSSSQSDVNTPSMNDMLKDRCSDSHQYNLRKGGNNLDAVSIEASLASLCLEPSMLLYTSHGMALHLSPSQLDALELLITNQLDAVRKAKGIQNRLLSEPVIVNLPMDSNPSSTTL